MDNLFAYCFLLASEEKQKKIRFSCLPFREGFYVLDTGTILMIKGASIYRLQDDSLTPAQSWFCLWHGETEYDFVDIPEDKVKRMGLREKPILKQQRIDSIYKSK